MRFQHIAVLSTLALALFASEVICMDRQPDRRVPQSAGQYPYPGVRPSELVPAEWIEVARARELAQNAQAGPSTAQAGPSDEIHLGGPSTSRAPTAPPAQPGHPARPVQPAYPFLLEQPTGTELARHEVGGSGSGLLVRDPAVAHWYEESPPWSDIVRDRRGYPKFKIQQVILQDGRRFGPYNVGSKKMQPLAYPLDIPFLRPLYEVGGFIPDNFERFWNRDQRRLNLQQDDIVYRPEPRILDRIHNAIADRVPRVRGTDGPRLVDVRYSLRNGEYLWPPTKVSRDRRHLEIAPTFLRQFHKRLLKELDKHRPVNPTLHHLTVQTEQGPRHILMFSGTWGRQTDIGGIGSATSDLWHFMEAMNKQEAQRPLKLVYLGGMGLPKDVIAVLRRARHSIISSAF